MAGEGDDGRNRTEFRRGDCQNCDRPDDELVAVHRMYVIPESWDTPGSSTVVDDVEVWCFSCRSMYPHQVAEPPD